MTESAQHPSPFSVPVPPDVLRSGRRIDVDTLTAVRQDLATTRTVFVRSGSLHASYPPPEDPSPMATVTDPRVIAALIAALTTVSSGEAGPGRLSDVVLEFTDATEDWFRLLTIEGGWVGDNRTATGWPVDADTVADALAGAGVPEDHLPRTNDPRRSPAPVPAPQGRALTRRWQERLPGSRPVSYELRSALSDRWIRFHSLPGSRRYPDSEDDRREIVRRHRAVLAEVSAGAAMVLLITASWSGDLAVEDRPSYLAALAPRSWFWDSIAVDTDHAALGCVHLWVDTVDRQDPRLDVVLRMVADDAVSGVILADPELRWLFAPYDGGVDVIATAPDQRDRLAARFHDWLPVGGLL